MGRSTLRLQALLFHNRISNLTVPRLLGLVAGRAQYVFENVDPARLQGVEFAGLARLPAGWTLSGNCTCLDATDGNGARL